ncbi:Rib/alpha-like domain-containing protein [Lactobacillus rodentium]|uniref:Gram-positive cocci surface proteins LPxTG domain-containing protein n=1 Tax=Lactobacillus rodentium TaxID=947835 RepID=A0A2Z6TE38_9LACO|nr:Rib/alpha-like domain-containing protein [Lactobacillus rodentium]MCR1894113.1 Rib/alpha-like domain-containing protein [Lactobacillus rodentium]GBG04410.1 hypothetical protein LrDSM24759_03240 [Lactobacillus rodentium]
MLHKHDVGYVNKLNGKQERFSFRKYSFGLASVLLGTAFFALATPNNNVVHADGLSTAQTQQQDNSVTQTASTVTRTINITDPETGKVTSTTQTASTKNNNGTWSGDSLDAVNIEKPGYTAHVIAKAYYEEKPTPQDTTTELGQIPDAKNSIANNSQMPTGTRYNFDNQPDINTEGKQNVTTKVSTPNGNEYNVKSTVDVVAPEQSVTVNYIDPNSRTVDTQTIFGKTGETKNVQLNVPKGYELVPNSKFPTSITFSNKTPDSIDVHVQYLTPIPTPTHTSFGKIPKSDDEIRNNNDLPSGSRITWLEKPDVTSTFNQNMPGKVTVIYPDGSTKVVDVSTIVRPSTPKVTAVSTDYGQIPDAGEAVLNKNQFPANTTYAWNDPDQVSKDVNTGSANAKIYPATVKINANGYIITADTTITVKPVVPDGQDVTTGIHYPGTDTSDNTTYTGHIIPVTGMDKASVPTTALFTNLVTTPNATQDEGQDIDPSYALGKITPNDKTPSRIVVMVTYTPNDQVDDKTITRTVNYIDPASGETKEVTKQTGTISRKRSWIEVENGSDHQDDKNLYRVVGTGSQLSGSDGSESDVKGVTIYVRSKIINYGLPESDPKRVTYTDWVRTDSSDNSSTSNDSSTENTSHWGEWSDWSKASFDAVSAPNIKGYTVENPDAAPKVDLSEDSTVTFTYSANSHNQIINYVDGDGTTVSTQTVTGKTGEEITVTPEVPNGYVTYENIPDKITFDTDDPAPITVKVIKKETSNGDVAEADNLPTKNMIIYKDGNGNVVGTQDITGKPNDKVKANIPEGYWNGDTDKVTIPESGIVTVNVVKKETSNGDVAEADNLPTKNVIIYKDGHGNVVGTQDITGKPNDKVKANIPEGYWNGDSDEVTIPESGVITVNVTKKETSNGDVAEADKLPTKTVIVYKDGKGNVVGTEDVAGKPNDKVKPHIPDGYYNGDITEVTIPESGVVTVKVVKKEIATDTPLTQNDTETKHVIIYKDSNGDVVGTQELTGKPGDKVTPKLPEGYISVDTPDLVIPKDGTPIVVNVVKEEIAKGPTENHEGKADDPIELNGPDSDSEKTTSSDSVTHENVNEDNPIKPDKLETKSATVYAYADIEDNISDKAKTLPQTGVQADKLGLLGLAIASVGALLGLAGTKRRKN